jgi:glutaredoxin 3
VFSKNYCPYSGATKLLLKSLGAKYHVVEINTVPDGKAIRKALLELNGQSSTPNIYINKKHIGGNSEIQSIGRSRLTEILHDLDALETKSGK